MKFQPRPRFEALAVRGRAHFSFKAMFVKVGLSGFCQGPLEAPGAPVEALGSPWKPLEPPGAPWNAWKPPHQHILGLIYGFRVLGTLNWDLRRIMTRALLRDTRSFSYRSVARPQYTFRLLVKCLWTPEGF